MTARPARPTHPDSAVNARLQGESALLEREAVHGGYIPPEMEGTAPNEIQATRELARLDKLGVGAVPPLGGRKVDHDPREYGFEFWTKKEAREAGHNEDESYEAIHGAPPTLTASEALQRQNEWTTHIRRVAEPLNPKSPYTSERVWREFSERYPEHAEEGHEAFASAMASAAKELGSGFLDDRFTLYSTVAKKMDAIADAEAAAEDAEPTNPQSAQMLREFRSAYPDLGGDMKAIEASSNHIMDTLAANGVELKWENRANFLQAVALDMRAKGTGKAVGKAKTKRQSTADVEPDEHDTGRTQGLLTSINSLTRFQPKADKGGGGDMMAMLTREQRKLGLI